MSNREAVIREYYQAVQPGSTVYLLRNEHNVYAADLPNPDSVEFIYKATALSVDLARYRDGVQLSDWPTLVTPPGESHLRHTYSVSPLEVFHPDEVSKLTAQTYGIPRVKPNKLDRFIGSPKGNFRSKLASGMASVVLQRFSYDPRIVKLLKSTR